MSSSPQNSAVHRDIPAFEEDPLTRSVQSPLSKRKLCCSWRCCGRKSHKLNRELHENNKSALDLPMPCQYAHVENNEEGVLEDIQVVSDDDCFLDAQSDTMSECADQRPDHSEDPHRGEEHCGVYEALQVFRHHLLAAMLKRQGPAGVPLAHAACGLVDAVLLGVRSHLPHIQAKADVHLDTEGSDVLLATNFQTSQFVGEIATKSRLPIEFRLSEYVRFALAKPSQSEGEAPLVLLVTGFTGPAISDTILLRERLRAELGDRFNPDSVYDWWLCHKDAEFPLQQYKIHRVWQSLFGLRSACVVPRKPRVDMLWACVHTTDAVFKSFQFWPDSRLGARVSVELHPPRTDKEAAIFEIQNVASKSAMRHNRKSGEILAASATNFGAMCVSRDIGQPPADANVITNLMTAAESWGAGSSGWQQWDDTWLCEDRRNSTGKIVWRQGRVIWREI